MGRTNLLLAMPLIIILAGCIDTPETRGESAGQEVSEGMTAPGPPPGGGAAESTKVSLKEGYWSFDLVTLTMNGESQNYSVITYYAGKTDSLVIIPSVLGGAPVREIGSQAFGHHGEIAAVYVPDSVEKAEEWAFYDLNEAVLISFANPGVSLSDGAFQSSGNATLYLPGDSPLKEAGGKTAVTSGTELLEMTLENIPAAAVAGGTYLNVPGEYALSADDIAALAVSADGLSESVQRRGNALVFGGSDYVPTVETASVYGEFADFLEPEDMDKTFRGLTAEQALALNAALASDGSYGALTSLLFFEAGYYLNGNRVSVDEEALAWDGETGESVPREGGLFPSTDTGKYKYTACLDRDKDGDIDEIYYSPFSLTYTYNPVTISSDNANLNGLSARDIMNPLYLSFANGVIEADGETIEKGDLSLATGEDGTLLEAEANQERSLLWATNYGSIRVDHLDGISTSRGNWAKMSYETGLDSYNVEIVMEWGMNALLYATNGGKISLGNMDGPVSTLTARGDGANGIIAGGTGTLGGSEEAPRSTAEVYLYNTDLNLTGWNNHVADVVYGGYAYLEKVRSVTGMEGSYAVGQASALANDFGNGVVDAKDFQTTVYGNRSAGAYVIGGGVITAVDSRFRSFMDAGLVSASGGTFQVDNSDVTGLIAYRNRGGIVADSLSRISGSRLTGERNLDTYTTGDTALAAVRAWEDASGGRQLIHYMMSDPEMTLGTLCGNYAISDEKRANLLESLGNLAGETYTGSTLLRGSVLDNTFYNYSAGAYTGETDFSDVPYLTPGSSFGGLVSSVMEFEAAGEQVMIVDSEMRNGNGADYNYLIASEAGSAPEVTLVRTDTEGIIWNEGDVQRVVEGRPGDRSSSLAVNFVDSAFTGSFADGSRGLWDVEGLSYTDGTGALSGRNGNYYGAEANGGIIATFDADSLWTVTAPSYLGSLTLEKGAEVKAPEGYRVEMRVDGKKKRIKAGTYEGDIEILLRED